MTRSFRLRVVVLLDLSLALTVAPMTNASEMLDSLKDPLKGIQEAVKRAQHKTIEAMPGSQAPAQAPPLATEQTLAQAPVQAPPPVQTVQISAQTQTIAENKLPSQTRVGAPDIVGIKIGMSPEQAMATIRAAMPRITAFMPQDLNKLPSAANTPVGIVSKKTAFGGVPPFLSWVTAIDRSGVEFSDETIRVGFAPGLAGAREVAIGAEREVKYKRGQELEVARVLAALKEKYGQSIVDPNSVTPNQFYWYYDATGRLLAEKPPGCTIIFGWTDAVNGITQEPTLLNQHIPCGTLVRAEIAAAQNQTLAAGVKVFMIDGPLQATHYKAARTAALEYARQQKANETSEAAKRGGGKF